MCTLFYISPGYKNALFAFKSERKSMKKTHPCVETDTEACTHFASRDNLQNGATLTYLFTLVLKLDYSFKTYLAIRSISLTGALQNEP